MSGPHKTQTQVSEKTRQYLYETIGASVNFWGVVKVFYMPKKLVSDDSEANDRSSYFDSLLLGGILISAKSKTESTKKTIPCQIIFLLICLMYIHVY